MARMQRDDRGQQVKDFEERVVRINPVSKTHKGGRTRSFNALVVVGDGNGKVGAGIGKAKDVPEAIRKGVESARRNMIKVQLVSGTITHEIMSSSGAATVLMKPASPGTGVVAGGSVRHILEAAGVKDVLSKSLGSSNPINNAWAALECLKALRTTDQIAALRGVPIRNLAPNSLLRDMGRMAEAHPAAESELVRVGPLVEAVAPIQAEQAPAEENGLAIVDAAPVDAAPVAEAVAMEEEVSEQA